jgi:hypothetical protein
MNYFEIIGQSFIRNLPLLLAWLVGIGFGVKMVRRRGKRVAWLFLTGCILLFMVQFIRPFLTGITQWLISEQGFSSAKIAGLVQSLPCAVLNLSAMVCLVYAFWVLFKKKAVEE